MNKENGKMTSKSWAKLILRLKECNLILKDGIDFIIGLKFDINYDSAPVIQFKWAGEINYYLEKIAEKHGIHCVEQKLLVRYLYDKVKEGKEIPADYYKAVAELYYKLTKLQQNQNDEYDDFENELAEGIYHQIYSHEKKFCGRTAQKALRRIVHSDSFAKNNIVEIFNKELNSLFEKYDIEVSTFYSPAFKTTEFYIDIAYGKYGLNFWHMIFISESEKKIIICNRHFIYTFNFSDVQTGLVLIKALINSINTELKQIVDDFCKSVETNPKLLEITRNTIRTLLEINYTQTGMEYGYNSDTVVSAIYLRERNSPKMYSLLIWNNDFIKHLDEVKEIVKNPSACKKDHVHLKEIKYNPKYLEEKFQKNNQPISQ